MLHKDEFASLEPLRAEVLLEKVSEYQEEADRLEEDANQLKAEAKEKSQEAARWHDKIALIARARRAGRTVRALVGGELTDEEPMPDEEPMLQFPESSGSAEPAHVAIAGEPGCVYLALAPDGLPCEVKEERPGAWWGRWNGRPCGMDLPTAAAAQAEVEKIVGKALEWQARVPDPSVEV